MLILGERLPLSAYLGFAIILVGVMIANGGYSWKLGPMRRVITQIKYWTPGYLTKLGGAREPVRL